MGHVTEKQKFEPRHAHAACYVGRGLYCTCGVRIGEWDDPHPDARLSEHRTSLLRECAR